MTTDNITISRAALGKIVGALEATQQRLECKCAKQLVAFNGEDVDALTAAQEAITEARAAMNAQGEAARLWCETCEGGGTVDNTLGGDNINATDHDKCPDCSGHGYIISSVYRTQATEPAQSSNPSGEHSEPSLLGSEPAPSTAGERVSPEVLRLRQQLDGITANLESYRERFNIAMKNCDRYTDRIAELEAAQSTQRERSESAISLHDAWLYFTGAEPSLSRLGQAIDQASALLQSTADHIGDANKMVAALPDPQLCKFYGVETYPELVTHMLHHIEKLQAKLPPTSDEQPGKARFA